MKKFNPERELYKLKYGKRDKIILGIFLLLVISLIGSTFALYQVRHSKRIIYTTVDDFSKDIQLAVFVDGDKVDKLPEKDKGYYYEGITCESDPDAMAGWDYTKWKLGAISVTIPNKCDIHFTSNPSTLIDKIKYVKEENSNMVIEDETDDQNLRYIGTNPNNYIWFNCDSYDGLSYLNAEDNEHKCEKWQIIGLFNEINKLDGTTENLVKIMRADSAGEMKWATSNSNNWTVSALKPLLENYYIGSALGSAKGITNSTKNMIEGVKWGIGGSTTDAVTASQVYEIERGSATWDAYIGLIYSSDYGYSTMGSGLIGDTTYDREGCLREVLYNWGNEGYKTNCADKTWIIPSEWHIWTLTPYLGESDRVYGVSSIGQWWSYWVGNDKGNVIPTLYLKSTIRVTSGKGSSEEPYILIP